MIVAAALALLTIADPPEALPVDEAMRAFEAAIPELRQTLLRAQEDIGRLGPPEPGWATSGLSATAAITANSGNVVEHVLGEWQVGSHGVAIPGDYPLNVPPGRHRYAVREYDRPVDYHTYHRLTPDIVLHTFGAATRTGNAECQRSPGIELIARQAWRSWSNRTALQAFGAVRAIRDEPRTFCMMYRPAADGRFEQVAFTSEGRPYLMVNENPQAFAVTSRVDAAERIFSETDPPSSTPE